MASCKFPLGNISFWAITAMRAWTAVSGDSFRGPISSDGRCSSTGEFAPGSHYLGPLLPYHDPKHGDIVVFLSPAEPGLYVVKRVIGVPGDRIHLRDGIVYRNGEALNEPYVLRNGSYNPYRDNFPAI